MNTRLILLISTLFCCVARSLHGFPVSLGSLEVGLESFDGYQEGMAYFSTDEKGTNLEILIAYKGFGLDEVSWLFSTEDLTAFRDSAAKAAWWRSRLLELNVDQVVLKDVAVTKPEITYSYRSAIYPFDDTESVLRFVRQGRDYALILTEISPGAETRRTGEKTLPIFTLHFSKKELPILRDLLAEANMERVIQSYSEQKSTIDTILAGAPE